MSDPRPTSADFGDEDNAESRHRIRLVRIHSDHPPAKRDRCRDRLGRAPSLGSARHATTLAIGSAAFAKAGNRELDHVDGARG
jgi:hypothetical protein